MTWLIGYIGGDGKPTGAYLAAENFRWVVTYKKSEARRWRTKKAANYYIRRYGLGGAWSVRRKM